MNKKGFTLVELIAVITIVALLSVIAISASAGMSANAKQKVYDEKIKSIETAASLWGQDNSNKFSKENCNVNGSSYKPSNQDVSEYTCYTALTVQYLANNSYIKPDTEEMTVVDPRDTSSTINHNKVIVYHYYNNYYAEYLPIDASNDGEITNTKIVINNGETFTIYRDVSVELTAYNANEYCISTTSSVCTSKWELMSDTVLVNHKLTDGSGLKTLYAIFRNNTQTKMATSTITLEIVDIPTFIVDKSSTTTPVKTLKNKITAVSTYLDSTNVYQYYLSNSKTTLTGGSWTNYTNGSEFTMGKDLNGTYYLYIMQIKDSYNQLSTINDITINDKIYHMFGPYNFKNIVQPPSYLRINNNVTTSSVTNNTKVTLYLEAKDNPSQMCFSNTSSNSSCKWIDYETSSSWNLVSGDGSKTVYVWIKDNLGNISTPISQTITLDTIAPAGTSLAINNATITNKVAVTLYPVASGSPSQMCFSNTSSNKDCKWITYATSSPWTLTTGDGSKTVYAWFKDAAGNVSSSINKSITLDTVAPVGTSLAINKATITNKVAVTLYPVASGSPTQMCFSNTSSNSSCKWITYASSTSWTLTTGDGTKTVYAWFKDAAGNVSSSINKSITLDTTAPVISFLRINSATSSVARVTSSSVSLYTSGTGTPSQMCFSNTSSNSGCTWKTYATTAQAWTLASGYNTKTVYVWFKDAAGNVSSAKNASVTVIGKFTDMILSSGGGATAIKNKGNPSFGSSATTNMGMYATTDQNGTTYYFRGAVTNNYVKFANKTWRIVRINGDGSTRLILNGSGGNTQYSTSGGCYFNESTYMGSASSATAASSCFVYNGSNVASYVNSWYKSNITGTNLNFIKTNAKFCNDYTYTENVFGSYTRLVWGKSPNLKCTVGSGFRGSAVSLSLPVGILSADEVALTGYVYNTVNTASYLNAGGETWAMSGAVWDFNNWAAGLMIFTRNRMFQLNSSNRANYRPVINILNTIKASGTGTSSDPYILYLP